ncbi:MAG: amidase [Acidimicrobiales bacterium]
MDLDRSDAATACARLAAGEVSSEELLDAQLARIESRDVEVHAVVALDVDRARARARAADEATARGESWGPLHGLPITVKDAFETEGLVTTCGVAELADHVPERDADAVARLRAAGAIVFGKTNLPPFASDIDTFNDIYGLTRNPWDPDRTPGGSSGGSAAAVATGMSLLELGSDIGGSIRSPAHYCGVFGHKATWGAVPGRGHIPPMPGGLAPSDLGVFGPLGRSVADLDLGVTVLTGDDVGGVPGARLPAAPERLLDLSGCRIGVWSSDAAAPTAADVTALVEGLGARLADAGARVDPEIRPSVPLETSYACYLRLLTAAMAPTFDDDTRALLQAVAATADWSTTDPMVAAAQGGAADHAHWLLADEQRWRVVAAWDRLFESVDVVLAPCTPVPAFPHDATPMISRTLDVDGEPVPAMLHTAWASLASLPLLPATAVPVGLVDGLPCGVQVIGPRFADRTTLAVAAHVEQLCGGFTPPPERPAP